MECIDIKRTAANIFSSCLTSILWAYESHNHPFPLRLLKVDIVIFFSRPVNLNDCCPLVGLQNK